MRGPGCFLLLAWVAAGCGGQSNALGLDGLLRVAGGQYVPGALPVPSGGPAVTEINSINNTVRPGQQNKRLEGRLGEGGQALVLGIASDPGYWIVPGGAADLVFPRELTFNVRYSLSPALPRGRNDVTLQAVDALGRAGPPSTLTLTAQSPVPDGALVVTLEWDTESDIDLHVVDPAGVDVWARNINSYNPAPGDPIDPDALAAGGVLDFDSNASCQIDGRRMENVLWRQGPPAGHYIVRVDAFSLCGQTSARWTVDVRLRGEVIAQAAGFSGESDTRQPHVAGGGLLAVEFDIP